MPFKKTLLGYDRKQVDATIDRLTLDAMDSARNADRLRVELDQQRQVIAELRRDHDQVGQALVSAHKIAAEIRDAAEREAREIILEARKRADETLREANLSLKGLEREIAVLAKHRLDAEQAYAGFVSGIVKAYECRRAVPAPSLPAAS